MVTDPQTAALHFHAALAIGQKLQFAKVMLQALLGLTHLRVDKPPTDSAAQPPTQLFLRLIATHTASDWQTRESAQT